MTANELTAGRLRELAERIGTLKAEWFESITCSVSPSPDDYRAMLLREDEPGSSAIIAQMMLDQDALDLAELANAVPQIIATMECDAQMRGALEALLRYEGHHVWCGHGKDDTKPCTCGLLDAHASGWAALQREPKEKSKSRFANLIAVGLESE